MKEFIFDNIDDFNNFSKLLDSLREGKSNADSDIKVVFYPQTLTITVLVPNDSKNVTFEISEKIPEKTFYKDKLFLGENE